MTTYFENLTIELYILYVFKTHVKFYANRLMLFNIRSINLFLCLILYNKNSKFKHLIDNIAISFWSSWKFAMVIQWQICQNSYPIKKNIEWSCSFNLQPSLLLKFVQNVIMLGLKKIRVVTNFLKSKKIIKFFKYCRGSLRSWAKAFSIVGWRVGSDPLS